MENKNCINAFEVSFGSQENDQSKQSKNEMNFANNRIVDRSKIDRKLGLKGLQSFLRQNSDFLKSSKRVDLNTLKFRESVEKEHEGIKKIFDKTNEFYSESDHKQKTTIDHNESQRMNFTLELNKTKKKSQVLNLD